LLQVANWDKLTAAIGNSSFMLKKRAKLLQAQSALNKAQISNIEKRIALYGDELDTLDELEKRRKKVAKEDIKTQEDNVKVQKQLLEKSEQDLKDYYKNIEDGFDTTLGLGGFFGVTEEDIEELKTKLKEAEGVLLDAKQKVDDINNEAL
jgi:hypothetical protein